MPQQQRGSASGTYGRNLGRSRPQGQGQAMYAGGSPNFNEATGSPYQKYGGGSYDRLGGVPGQGGRYGGFNPGGGDPRQQMQGAARGQQIQALGRGQQGQQMQQAMQQMQRQQMMRRLQQQAMMRMLAQRQQGMGQGPGMPGIY
jgi:hypothetical protein